MKKTKIKLTVISLLLTLSLVLSALPGCITITSPEVPSPEPPVTTPAIPPTPINPEWTPPATANQTVSLPSIADVVALVKPSVVAITTEVVSQSFFGQFTQEGAGSGWILDKDGIIVTNNHVIAEARTITVTTDDGRTFTADTNSISTDPLNDLAILKIDARDLPALKRGDTSKLRVGDWVVAIGNALGQGIRATEGIVSRKGVSLPVSREQTLYDLLETSAAINPGNSGGPLVNLAGEVIGITSAKVAQVGVEGMGYAISIDTALPIVQELVNRGYVTRPWLGVKLITLDPTVITAIRTSPSLNWEIETDKGVLITEVVPDSPAAKAGLQAGDVVIEMANKEVTTTEELIPLLRSAQIGQPLKIIIRRGSAQSTVRAIPVEAP